MNVIKSVEQNEGCNEEVVEELIWKSQSGEAHAIEELLRIYEKLILRISKRYYFQDGETDDVIQECRIAFWQSVMSYKKNSYSVSLESFAYICINRRLASALRQRNKRSTKAHNEAVARSSVIGKNFYTYKKDFIIASEDIEKEYILKETQKNCFDYIKNNISEECSKIVKMREEGYSYLEIGESLNISVKKVDNSLRKVKKNIINDDIYN